jgi:ABC-2 type transport system ATP-binding protein
VAQIRTGTAAKATVQTEQPLVAARIMRELGLGDVRTTHTSAVGVIGEIAPEKIVAACVHQGVPVTGFSVDSPSLEEVFVHLTGEGFDVSG